MFPLAFSGFWVSSVGRSKDLVGGELFVCSHVVFGDASIWSCFLWFFVTVLLGDFGWAIPLSLHSSPLFLWRFLLHFCLLPRDEKDVRLKAELAFPTSSTCSGRVSGT